jgi:hypothetical protein
VFVFIDRPGVSSMEELFPVMGVFVLRGRKNHSPLEPNTVEVEPQCLEVCLIK